MTLPIKTTVDDVVRIVDFLKTKPAGCTVQDAKTLLESKYLDGRKLKAYQDWGFVKDADGQLRLDDRGWALARRPDEQTNIILEALDSIASYRAAIEWAYHQGLESVTVNDVAAYWIEHHKSSLGTENEETIKAACNAFFSLAQGAGLGTYVLGRRGNPTRFDFNRARLDSVIHAGPSALPHESDEEDAAEADQTEIEPRHEAPGGEPAAPPSTERPAESLVPEKPDLRVFIAHGKNMDIVEQVETILGLADIESEYAEAEESPAIPVPEKVLGAMRRCSAGIICVSVDEGHVDGEGNPQLNENVLIEIGAAFVLYDRRVVLLWDRRLDVPSNLQGLYRCEYEGDELNWAAGMKLMKAIKSFREG